MARIPLPEMTARPNAKTHAYPFQIGLQTQEFMQGGIFLGAFTDVAAGKYIRLPKGIDDIENELMSNGLDRKTIADAWAIIEKHTDIHRSWLFQNVLVLIVSHWDWYIRKLGEFVEFGLVSEDADLNKKSARRLSRIGFEKIEDQIDILESVTGLSFEIQDSDRRHYNELSLVRNLGLHNRWEVDAHYLDRTEERGFAEGDIRIFDQTELEVWHGAIVRLVGSMTAPVGVRFVEAPAYPVAGLIG